MKTKPFAFRLDTKSRRLLDKLAEAERRTAGDYLRLLLWREGERLKAENGRRYSGQTAAQQPERLAV